MVDRAGGAASLSFDNEGPPDITEIVLCVGGNGRVSGGSSWRAKKQTLGDGAHHGANHGGTSTYPTVRPNSPFVHLVSSETSDERAPGGGNVLAGGRLDLAVRCLPLGTWTVGDNLLPMLSFPSILRTNSFPHRKCILCDVENFICFILHVQDKSLNSLLSSTTTGNFLGGGEVASLSPPPLVGKMMGFGMFQKAPIASHANPRVDNPSPTPTATTLGVSEGPTPSTATGNSPGGGDLAISSPPPMVVKITGSGPFRKVSKPSDANPRVKNPSTSLPPSPPKKERMKTARKGPSSVQMGPWWGSPPTPTFQGQGVGSDFFLRPNRLQRRIEG